MERDFAALLEQCRRGGVEVRADSRQVGPGDVFVAVPARARTARVLFPQPWRRARLLWSAGPMRPLPYPGAALWWPILTRARPFGGWLRPAGTPMRWR